ncbi:histidine kinase [Tumidithrix helvetica PCC 7403]|uniref:sensor histidine kinase n=1 Tax=Tumidithrix helvetica TaxID=3457545 RepID=UPI003C8A681B
MGQIHRLLYELGDPLPIHHRFPSDYPTFGSCNLDDIEIEVHRLHSQSLYAEVEDFFQYYPKSIGVLITEAQSNSTSKLVAMISRDRFAEWRSQPQWQQALDRPIHSIKAWWQESLNYLQIDAQLRLQDAISLLLDRPTHQIQEPVVIHKQTGDSLVNPIRLFAAHTSLTQSKQAIYQTNQDVENLRRQHQLILNAVGEGVYGVDLSGKVTFVNPAAAQMIGCALQDLIGKSMHQVLHHSKADRTPYPLETCPIYAAFQDGIIHRVADEVFWRKDGTSFPVEYISTPMRNDQGQLIGAVVAFRDITERKWAEAVLHRANEELEKIVGERTSELYEANKELRELSELRSRMVSMVCHEFGNPLNNILFSVSSLERYQEQLSLTEKQSYIFGIKENVERMVQMIDAILSIGKVEAKNIQVHPCRFDLIEFCHHLISEIQQDSTSNRIELISRAKHLFVNVDKHLLRSILVNILSNSLRYSEEHLSIQFKLQRKKQLLVFQVRDRGIGIPSEDLPYLFEPFYRACNVSNIPGSGLGLHIVKRFVDLLQGKIEVTSKLGMGTTFKFSLPI